MTEGFLDSLSCPTYQAKTMVGSLIILPETPDNVSPEWGGGTIY